MREIIKDILWDFVDWLMRYLRISPEYALLIKVIIIILLLSIIIFKFRTKILKKLPKIRRKPKFQRWEDMLEIIYGHIPYEPLLSHDINGNPKGIGLSILQKIFEVEGVNFRLEAFQRKSSWSNAIERLVQGEYDIIATPIFETHDRSKKVAFSTPLFFADIGIYMPAECIKEILDRRIRENVPMRFREAIELIQQRSFVVTVIKGELSEKMAKKYLKKCKIKYENPQDMQISRLLDSVSGKEFTVVFVERFIAESYSNAVRNGRMINILKPGELLYPVSFAMRKEDYPLRNFVNIRLMEIDDSTEGGITQLLINELEKTDESLVEKAKDFFMRKKEWR